MLSGALSFIKMILLSRGEILKDSFFYSVKTLSKSLTQIFTLGMATVLLAACGGGDDNKSPQTIVENIYDRTPVLLARHDNNCSSSQSPSQSLAAFYIDYNKPNSQLHPTQSSDYFFDLNKIWGLPYLLTSTGIQKTIYGEVNLETDPYKDENGDIHFTETKIEGDPLPICATTGSFPNNSIESMGLATSYILHEIQDQYQQWRQDSNKASEFPQLPGINLFIQTLNKIEFEYTKDSKKHKIMGTLTDNAYYFKDELHFVPHSVEWKESNPTGTYYWSTPFVVAHEYGHHVFKHTLLKHQLRTHGLHRQTAVANCFPSHELGLPINRLGASDEGEYRSIKDQLKLTHSSFNEGFADLFAYYSLTSHKKLKLFHKWERTMTAKNRDLENGYFYDGSKKALTHDNWKKFARDSSLSQSDYQAGKPDFSDNHVVGAVFAHFTYKILNTVNVKSESGQMRMLNSEEKMKVLFQWLYQLKVNDYSLNSQYRTASGIVMGYVEQLLEVIHSTQNSDLTSEQCGIMKEVYSSNDFYNLGWKLCKTYSTPL